MRLLTLLCFILICASCNDRTPKQEIAFKDAELKEMIGQMIMVGFRGFNIEEVSDTIKKQIKEGKVGGFVLFDYDVINKEAKRNIANPIQVSKFISDLQSLAAIPMFAAVDQEGGRVNRLKEKYGFPASVSNKYLGTLDDVDTTRHYAKINSETLKKMGFNVNFSPAVDLEINPDNPVIGKVERSYSAIPEIVVKHSEIWIDEHAKRGILSTLKHFPGHGSSHSDSHYGVTDITKYWNEIELKPFEELLANNNNIAVMTAHVVNKNLDDEMPATLSKKIIDGILREKWNYEGVIFSDDLQMKAVNAMFDFETIISKSIEAGVDVIVTGNNLEYDEAFADKALNTIFQMVRNFEISEERIKKSYDRIMLAKNGIGLTSSK